MTEPLDCQTYFHHDVLGRTTQVTLPGGRAVLQTYDGNNQVTSISPPAKPAHQFLYDEAGRMTEYFPPDVGAGTNSTVYDYDADGNLAAVHRADGISFSLAYDYDNGGRLDSAIFPHGTIEYDYHPATGQLAAITAPDGGQVSFSWDGPLLTGETWAGNIAGTVNRDFNADFLIAEERINGGSSLTFTYDDDGLLSGAGELSFIRDPQTGLIIQAMIGNLDASLSHTLFGGLESYSAAFGDTDLYAAEYEQDALGRVIRKTESIGALTKTIEYGYDAAGRIANVTVDGVITETYSYDQNGNRLAGPLAKAGTGGVYDLQDRMTSYGATNYSYTAQGELLTKTEGPDVTTYDYDGLGLLQSVLLPDGTEIAYVVDGLSRRIGKKIDGTLVQGFLYGDQVAPVAELDGASAVISRFVYGASRNVPDYMEKGGALYFLVREPLGTVRLVVNTATGEIVQRLDYDAFGRVLLDTNPGFQPFGFAGGLYDPDTGLTRFGYRDYDAERGRWTTKDPLLFGGGDTNLYAYALNDPVNWHDPDGLNNRFEGLSQDRFRGLEGVIAYGNYPLTRRAADWVARLGDRPGTSQYVAILTSPIWAPLLFYGAFQLDSLITSPIISIPLRHLSPSYRDFCEM